MELEDALKIVRENRPQANPYVVSWEIARQGGRGDPVAPRTTFLFFLVGGARACVWKKAPLTQ